MSDSKDNIEQPKKPIEFIVVCPRCDTPNKTNELRFKRIGPLIYLECGTCTYMEPGLAEVVWNTVANIWRLRY